MSKDQTDLQVPKDSMSPVGHDGFYPHRNYRGHSGLGISRRGGVVCPGQHYVPKVPKPHVSKTAQPLTSSIADFNNQHPVITVTTGLLTGTDGRRPLCPDVARTTRPLRVCHLRWHRDLRDPQHG